MIYVCGGRYPDDSSQQTEFYDVAKRKWTQIGNLQKGRYGHTLVALENRYLYAICGRESLSESLLDSIERVDTWLPASEQVWEPVPVHKKDQQWSARDTIGAFGISAKEIVIFGGDQGWISDSFVLDCEKGEVVKEEFALKKPEEFGSG